MYSYLVNDNSEHKKAKSVNRNVVATVSHNEYKDVLLNKKCLRHSINRIQRKDHRIGTYEINNNHLNNILRLSDVLPNFLFSTSEAMRNYYL